MATSLETVGTEPQTGDGWHRHCRFLCSLQRFRGPVGLAGRKVLKIEDPEAITRSGRDAERISGVLEGSFISHGWPEAHWCNHSLCSSHLSLLPSWGTPISAEHLPPFPRGRKHRT